MGGNPEEATFAVPPRQLLILSGQRRRTQRSEDQADHSNEEHRQDDGNHDPDFVMPDSVDFHR